MLNIDKIAIFMFAMSIALRARLTGAHITGSIVLGFFCSLSAPLLRESVLSTGGVLFVLQNFPLYSILGACCGIFLIYLKNAEKIFVISDAFSLGLTSAFATILALNSLNVTGALVLGMIVGLLPAFLRDISLGDMASMVVMNWYVSASALGCMIVILGNNFFPKEYGFIAIFMGSILVILLRLIEEKKIFDRN